MTSVGEDAPARRRGRPYRLPEDTAPLTRVHGGVEQRVAWLLGSSRIYATDPAMANREQFLSSLRAIGVSADQTRVSRWESGNQRVPAHVLASYEQLLGLPDESLAAASEGVRRSLDPQAGWPPAVSVAPGERWHRDLDRLFDAVTGGEAAGKDWRGLVRCLHTHPDIYLRPDTWGETAEQLVREASRSVGLAYLLRFEAMRMLVRHPAGQVPAVKAIGAFVTDPDAQLVATPLMLLQEVEAPQAGELLLRMLATETGARHEAAAWAVAAKLARGHFTGPSLAALESLVLRCLQDAAPGTPDTGLFDIVARLPYAAGQRILRATADSASNPRLELVLRHGELLPPDVTRQVAAGVAEAAQAATPAPYRIEPDLMLQRLVREALFHGHQERRHQSALLLMVSPYRAGLAAACVTAGERGDEEVALRAAMLLTYVGTDAERDVLLGWATEHARPEVRSLALTALARLEIGLSPREEQLLVKGLETEVGSQAQQATLYALAMHDASALDDLAADGSTAQRRAATWWRRLGPAIHESARRS